MALLSKNAEVVVIGAGVCGLATALALANHGLLVSLVEWRVHPDSATGKALSRELKQELLQINQTLSVEPGACVQAHPSQPNDSIASVQHARAANLRRKLWGAFERSLVLDAHSVQYLASMSLLYRLVLCLISSPSQVCQDFESTWRVARSLQTA